MGEPWVDSMVCELFERIMTSKEFGRKYLDRMAHLLEFALALGDGCLTDECPLIARL